MYLKPHQKIQCEIRWSKYFMEICYCRGYDISSIWVVYKTWHLFYIDNHPMLHVDGVGAYYLDLPNPNKQEYLQNSEIYWWINIFIAYF